MHIESSFYDGKLTMRLNGELDLVVAEKFRSEADMMLLKYNPKLIVINLEAVPFIDSSGLGALLGRYKKISESGGKIVLVAVKTPVMRILELSGFNKIMEIHGGNDSDISFGQG